jgi:hypothetical protein
MLFVTTIHRINAMNKIYLVLISVVMISGCTSINQGLLLNKGTKVEIMDVSKDPIISGDISSNSGAIAKRIIEYTKDELSKRSIETITENTVDAAKLKYEVRNVSKGFF